MDRRQFTGLAMGLAACAAGGRALGRAAATDPDALFDRLEAFGFSGGAVLVENGRVAWRRAAGWADRDRAAPFSADTPFNIASVTKPITALTALRLVEEGVLALDQPLGRWLPSAPADKAVLTVHQLLSHTSGLPRQVRLGDAAEREAVLALLLAARPEAAPGERFIYSNVGFCLLGAVIEAASGTSYREAVRRRVFAPAGMAASGFAQDYAGSERPACGYDAWKDIGTFAETHRAGWYEGAGNVVSTLGDMARLVLALESGRIVGAGAVALATRKQSPDAGTTGYDGYGYGWYLGESTDGDRLVVHGGDNPGYHGELRWYPEARRWLYVIATNEIYDDSGAGVGPHARVIANDLIKARRDIGFDAPPAVRPASSPSEPRLVGVWRGGGGRIEILRRHPRDHHLTAYAVGQAAADALTGADTAQAAANAAANARSLALADLIRREDETGLKRVLGSLAFFAAGWVSDFRDWRSEHGAFEDFGAITSRHTPFGDPQIRTHLPFRFERGEAVLEFTWNGDELYETLTGRDVPSPAILPVAELGDGRFSTWDMVMRKGVELKREAGRLRLSGAAFVAGASG